MFPLRGTWDHDEVAAFLTETTVPIRLSCHTPDGGLWMLSLWYRYDADAGAFRCATSASADVVIAGAADAPISPISVFRPIC